MHCRQARALFSGRIDRELGSQDSVRLQQHLDACPSCARRWASFEMTVRLVRSLPQTEPDPSFVGHVLDRVRAYEAGQRTLVPMAVGLGWGQRLRDAVSAIFSPRVLAPARLAGALALGLFVGVIVSDRGGIPDRFIGASGSGSRSVAAVSGTGTAEGTSTVGRLPDRPFIDLAEDLADGGSGQSGLAERDSVQRTAPSGDQADPRVNQGFPGSPGRQVISRQPDGSPHITF